MPRETPYSLEAEQAVLGGLLLYSAAWARVTGLTASDFYRPDHRLIFSEMEALGNSGRPFDAVLIADALERRRVLGDTGGLAYLGQLGRDTPGIANIEAYAAKVRGYALLRRLQDFGNATAKDAADAAREPAEILAQAQERLIALHAVSRTGKGLVSTQELTAQFVDDMDSRRDRQFGLRTGLGDFDDLTHGLEPGDLVVMAGRPGMGKTALLVTIAAHVAISKPVAVFSAEMPAMQLMRRCTALLGGISQGRLRRADKLTDSDWVPITEAIAKMGERQIWVDDSALPTSAHIRSECLSLKARSGLGLVIVDYIQLVQGQGGNRYEQLRDVAYGMKAMAKDLAVPVIVLAQLNRGVESREEKRPMASDLRDSGAIEEAADIIGLLYSEGYYDSEFLMPHVLECKIEKHRNGERGECLWRFEGEFSRITVLDHESRVEYRRLRMSQQAPRRKAGNSL